MANITVTVPDEFKEEMEEHSEINWSQVARDAFEQKILDLRTIEKLKDFEIIDEIAEKSEMTDKDVEEIAEKIDSEMREEFLGEERVDRREVFENFADRAKKKLGDSLKKLVLYGSVARDDETEDSDIDVFAVVEEKRDLEELRELAFDIGVLEHGVSISVQGEIEKDFEGFSDTSFLRNVERDGVEYA